MNALPGGQLEFGLTEQYGMIVRLSVQTAIWMTNLPRLKKISPGRCRKDPHSHLVCHRLITASGRKQIGMWVVFSHPENRARHWRSFRANQHQIIGVGSVSWQCPKVTCKEVILETGSNFLCKRSRMPMMHVAIGAEVSNLAVSLLVRRLRLVKWYANYPVSLETRRTIQPMHSVGLAIVGQHWARWSIRSVTLRECMLRRLTSQNALHPSMPITPPLFQHLVHLDNPIDRSAIFPHWGLGASQ